VLHHLLQIRYLPVYLAQAPLQQADDLFALRHDRER